MVQPVSKSARTSSSAYRDDLKPLYEAYSALGRLQERANVETSPPAILVVGQQTDGKSGEQSCPSAFLSTPSALRKRRVARVRWFLFIIPRNCAPWPDSLWPASFTEPNSNRSLHVLLDLLRMCMSQPCDVLQD